MKWLWITLLTLAFASPALAGITLNRAYTSGRRACALVTYTNTSGRTFRNVTIRCTALSSNGTPVGVNTRSFFHHEYGDLRPGFTGTLEVPVAVHGADWSSISCSVNER